MIVKIGYLKKKIAIRHMYDYKLLQTRRNATEA